MSNVKCQMLNVRCQNFETSQALKELFYQYTHLPIGKKEIICPYWKNDLERGIFGPFGGKGTPMQIVQATEEEAKKDGVDLTGLSAEEILNFMREKKIGVDCSGFVFWMLDALDKEKGGNGIADDIPGCEGRFIKARANVRMLTDKQVSFPVELKDIRVGDMIRLKGGRHVAIVMTVIGGGNVGELKEVQYCHSSEITQIGGVHFSKILIDDLNLGFKGQKWQELTTNGKNYGEVCYLPQLGDGIFRLKNFV